MMDYESFKERVMDEFLSYMPERYSDCTIELRKVPKVNSCLTGLVIIPKGKPRSYCSPTFYMERMYEQYLECDDFEQVMANQAVYLEESIKFLPEDIMKLDFDSLKDKIVFQIVNTKENQEMIKHCPHRSIMDLSVVYRVIVNVDEHGVSGFLVTNDIANAEDLPESLLYRLAKKNTKKLFPFKSERIEDTMKRMMKRWGVKDKDIEASFAGVDEIPLKDRVYVLSNEYEFFGANALLYTDVLKKVVKNIGTDCYILPSSVHDLVILSTETFSESSRLRTLVKDTNFEHVRLSDRLSDNIYRFSIVDGSLTCVTEESEAAS